MIELDGSHGEGGGQILRSALALSILTRRPFKLVNVRAGRKDPGLRPSHVMSVKAAAQICGGSYTGASVGSSTLSFEPGEVKAGKYMFSICTAGATGLVLHTMSLPLALRRAAGVDRQAAGPTAGGAAEARRNREPHSGRRVDRRSGDGRRGIVPATAGAAAVLLGRRAGEAGRVRRRRRGRPGDRLPQRP